ncbi:MAG: hypothetical protein IJV36_06950 [Prevotella sp.]|nr:hypothetical protein [Prevotella sp.]
MKHLRLLLAFLIPLIGGGNLYAQKDVTATYITNATLSNGTTGWTVSNFNAPQRGNNTVGYASEAYAGWGSLEKTSYGLTQTITLPKGNYRLVNYSFFRQGENYNNDPEKSLAYLKAGDNQVAVKTLGSITASGYANTQAEGANAFDSKMYRNTLDFSIDADNTSIEIGLVGTFDVMRSWCIAGMFELIDLDQEATVDAPFDVTGYIVNPGFEYRDMSGWTLTPSDAFGAQGNTSFDNKSGGFYAERWQEKGGLSDRSMKQTINNIPNGLYNLSVYSFYGGTGAYIKANDNQLNISASTSGKYTVSTEVTDGTITIEAGLSGGTSNWICFDRFELSYKGDPTVAIKALWEEALAAAKAAIANNDYENVTGDERTALQTEIDKAEPTTADGYSEATAALNSATQVFTNAKAAYDALVAVKDTTVPELAYAAESKKEVLTSALSATATNASEAQTMAVAITTALRAYYESHALAEGVDGAVNMTDKIVNGINPTQNEGWTFSGMNNPASNESWTDADGTNNHSYFDGGTWGANSWTASMKQDILLLPGKYLLTAKARAAQNVTFTMSVGEASVELPHVGSAGNVFDRGWGDASVEFESDGVANSTILVSASSSTLHEWFSISAFRLIQLEQAEAAYADDDDYVALAAAIELAEGKTLGFEAEEYAPYNNVEALNALQAAKEIDVEADNVKLLVTNVTDALNAATWVANTEEVNAVYNGMFATVQEGANYPDAWTRTNAWGQMRTEIEGDYATAYYNQPGSLKYGENGVYTMPLKANTAYRVTFAYRSHENNSNNGVTVSVLNGEDGLNGKVFERNVSTSEWKTGTTVFTTGAAGNYVLTLANNGNTWMTNVSIFKAVAEEVTFEDAATEAPAANDYANVTYARTLVAGYNTLVLPFEVTKEEIGGDAVEEIYAYNGCTVTGEGENAVYHLDFQKGVETLAANTPYLVKMAEAKTGLSFEGKTIAPAEAKVENDYFTFVGTYVAFAKNDANNPIVAGDFISVAAGLKKAAGGNKLNAFRAYLKNNTDEEAVNVKISINDGEVDAITAAEITRAFNGEIYNLQGQQVNKTQKGVYIVNGKKIVIK